MRVYDYNAYKWTGCVAPGNMAGIDPHAFSKLLDKHDIPWHSDGSPYTSGLVFFCDDKELQKNLLEQSRKKRPIIIW